MFSTEREKKLLARKKSQSDIQSYEDYKRQQDEDSYLNTGISGKTLDKIGSSASKVGDFFKDIWHEVSTPRWKKQKEERKKKGQ